MKSKFLTIVNTSENEAELKLYGPIVQNRGWFWDDDDLVVQSEVLDELDKLKDKTKITVRINSSGGDVFVAQALYTNLKNHKAKITVVIDGIAASAATIIAMAGDKVIMPSNSMMMIHDPMVGVCAYLNAEKMEKMADTLEKVKKSIMNAYLSKISLSEDEVYDLMREETWLTADEAIEKGFADEIMFGKIENNTSIKNDMLIMNGISHDISQFKNKPNFLNADFKPLDIDDKKENTTKGGFKAMTLQELKKDHPELVNTLKNELKDEVKNSILETERKRLADLDELKNAVTPELLAEAKYKTFKNAEELALKALMEQGKKGDEYLNNSQKDIKDSKEDDIPPAGEETPEEPAKKETYVDRITNFAQELDKKRRGIE